MHQNLNKLQLPHHLILDHDVHSGLTSDWIGPHSWISSSTSFTISFADRLWIWFA